MERSSTTKRPFTWTRPSRCLTFTWDSSPSVQVTWTPPGASSRGQWRCSLARTRQEYFSLGAALRGKRWQTFAAPSCAVAGSPDDCFATRRREACGTARRLRPDVRGGPLVTLGRPDRGSALRSRGRGSLRTQGQADLGDRFQQKDDRGSKSRSRTAGSRSRPRRLRVRLQLGGAAWVCAGKRSGANARDVWIQGTRRPRLGRLRGVFPRFIEADSHGRTD